MFLDSVGSSKAECNFWIKTSSIVKEPLFAFHTLQVVLFCEADSLGLNEG